MRGTVQGFNSEARTSKAGKRFNVHLVNVDGTWYECGYNKPKGIGIGDVVEYNPTTKYGKQVLEDGAIYQVGSGPAPAAPTAPPPAPSSGGRSYGGPAKEFPVPALHPDRSIIRQNALAHATRAVVAAGTSAVHPDEELAERIIRMAYHFEEYATGHREVKAMQDGQPE